MTTAQKFLLVAEMYGIFAAGGLALSAFDALLANLFDEAGAALGESEAEAKAQMSSKALGDQGQAWLEKLAGEGGTSQKPFSTTLGKRVVDYFKDGVAMESKNGYVKMSSQVAKQILKDAELMTTKDSGVTKVVWHFFKGADKAVLDFLADHGIEWVIH